MAEKFLRSSAAGAGTGADWTNAYTTMVAAAAGMSAGDTLWVADDHNESSASAQTITFPGTAASPNFIYCVDHTQAAPGTGDLIVGTVGAGSVTTTGGNAINISGTFYMYGVAFSNASGAVSTAMGLSNSAGSSEHFEQCTFVLGGTSGGQLGAFLLTNSCHVRWTDCTAKFSSTAAQLDFRGVFVWEGGSVDITTAKPSNLFRLQPNTSILCDGCDFSNLTSVNLVQSITSATAGGRWRFKNCKLASTTTVAAGISNALAEGSIVESFASGAAATPTRAERYAYTGTLTTVTGVVRTGGASDGVTPHAFKLATNAVARWTFPFRGFPLFAPNATTGAARTVTIYGIADPRDFSALPNDDDIWIDVEYLGSASDPQGTFKRGSKANNLATGSALTADTSAWDSAATARANSTAYSLGDIIKLASNSGRLFLCTTAGTSSGSEPAGYASAVDGGSVTDGTATFKAMWRFKQSVATTGNVGLAGLLQAHPKVAKASLNGIYIDPKIEIA